MGLFQLLNFGGNRSNSALHFLGHPHQAVAIKLLKDENWGELEALLARLSTDELHPMLSGLSEVAMEMKELPSVPESGVLTLLKGYVLLLEAWKERSGKIADQVTDEQFERFWAVLDHAEDLLNGYLIKKPSSELAYGKLFKVAMGQGIGTDELYQLFIRYTQNTLGHLSAHIAMATDLTEQWGGSHVELFSFCRTSAKLDSRYSALIAFAHYQRWFYSYHFEDDVDEDLYFQTTDVVNELTTAFEAHQCANVSIYEKRLADNYFSFCFALSPRKKLFRDAFKNIMETPLPQPWESKYTNILKGFKSLKQEAGL